MRSRLPVVTTVLCLAVGAIAPAGAACATARQPGREEDDAAGSTARLRDTGRQPALGSAARTSIRKGLDRARQAYGMGDESVHEAAVESLVRAMPQDAPMIREELREVLANASRAGSRGVGPVINAYLSELIRLVPSGLVAESGLQQRFDGSPLAWVRYYCLEDEGRVVESAERLASGEPPDGVIMGADCIDLGEASFVHYPLQAETILDPVDVGGFVSIVLDPPGTPDSIRISNGVLPGNLLFDSQDGLAAIYTPLLTSMFGPARTQVFTITATSAGVSSEYRVVLPVNLKIQGGYQHVLSPGESADIFFEASGGPDSCGTLPPAAAAQNLPCGGFSWTWTSIQGAPDLAAGLSRTQPTNGTLRLQGTIQQGAVSSRGRWAMQQGSATARRSASFEVPVHFAAADLAALMVRHEVERDEVFSLQLPQALGGDGVSYEWSVRYSQQREVPAGIQYPQRAGNSWSMGGTVDADAAIGTYDAGLEVTSPLGPGASIPLTFRLTVPFRIWTQNTILRPPDLPALVEDAVDRASSWIGGLVGFLVGSPFASAVLGPLGGAVATIVGGGVAGAAAGDELVRLAEEAYDEKIQNTQADNADRTDRILNEIPDYDVIALQEVFDKSRQAALLAAMRGQYHALLGPPAGTIGPDIEIGTNSGLLLLVKRALATAPRIEALPLSLREPAYQLNFFEHRREVYRDGAGFDILAQKGFTFDKVHFGSDPSDFIFVVNTHTQADADMSHIRLRQFRQLRAFLDSNWVSTHPLLVMGDLNVVEQSPRYSRMLLELGLLDVNDTFRERWNQQGPSGLVVDGFTIDVTRNAYALNWGSPGAGSRERLDYVFIVQGSDYGLEVDSIDMVDLDRNGNELVTDHCQSQSWLSPRVPPTLLCYISDHFGLRAELRLTKH